MNDAVNRQILLAERPVGEPTGQAFPLVETDVPTPGGGFPTTKVLNSLTITAVS